MTDKKAMQMALTILLEYYEKENGLWDRTEDAIDALLAALAQPEPEPVAWISTSPARMIHWTSDKPAYGDDWIPLYTAPQQREWVGLTDDEYELMAEKRVTNYFFNTLDYAHDIEAMLKEKNGG